MDVSKSPNFLRFIVTGAVLGFLLGAWVAWSGVLEEPGSTPTGYNYGASDGIGIVGMLGAVIFGTLAAVIAVLVDRRNR